MCNRLFTGREDVLEKVHGTLEWNRRAALSGLGGTGKTQIAITATITNAVFFIRADTETALTAGMVEIASVLALPSRDAKDEKETVDVVKRIWEEELGPEHPYVAWSLNGLAELYRAQGQYAKAEPLYQPGAGDPGKGAGAGAPRRGNIAGELRMPSTRHESCRGSSSSRISREANSGPVTLTTSFSVPLICCEPIRPVCRCRQK